tara:strand:- start:318 stop:803 length:486 start_codon:yes stop_codon:yes gene_type:complete
MSKVVSISEGGNVATLLSFRDPSRANAQLVRELNALSTVRVNGINIEVDKVPDAIAAVANIEAYLTPHKRERVEQLFSRWKYLFQRPYETSMDECSTRVDIMIESLIDLPADCIMHIYNQSIKSFRILPPYSDVYALVKKEYEMRKIYLELFQNKVDELQK